MDVILKVISGGKKGAKVALKKPEFLIGRSQECHLTAGTNSISRKHCAIRRDGTRVTIADLGSRNGTKVNGEKIAEETELKSGDEIGVGPLQFMITMSTGIANEKKPKVKSVAEAAERAAERGSDSGSHSVAEEDITEWLLGTPDPAPAVTETQTIRMDDTDAVRVQAAIATENQNETSTEDNAEAAEAEGEEGDNPDQPEPGKLPPIPKETTKDSREAAAQALRNWNRRR
ncbi:MAG: FHA domain-containing protein [Planctomycetota bacterium]